MQIQTVQNINTNQKQAFCSRTALKIKIKEKSPEADVIVRALNTFVREQGLTLQEGRELMKPGFFGVIKASSVEAMKGLQKTLNNMFSNKIRTAGITETEADLFTAYASR